MLTGLHRQNYDLNMQRVVGLPDDPANQDDFYGAQLSLIYYRALTDQAQTVFRARMREGYSQPVTGPAERSRAHYYRRLDAHFSLAFGAMSINPMFVETNSGPVRKEGQFFKGRYADAAMVSQRFRICGGACRAARRQSA